MIIIKVESTDIKSSKIVTIEQDGETCYLGPVSNYAPYSGYSELSRLIDKYRAIDSVKVINA